MQLPEQFNAYIAQICDQLRWKKARPVIQREMEAHLCDQYDAFVKSGMPEDAAVEETLHRTGDAVEIGTGLDRVHRPKPSWGLLILTGILLLTGLAVKLFFTYDSNYPYELPKMLIASVLGIGCLFGAYFIDFTLIGKRPVLLYVCTLALILFLRTFYSRYEPYLSLFCPVVYSALLYRLRGKRYLGFLLSLLCLGLLSTSFILHPSFAAVILIAASGFVLLTVAVLADWFELGRVHGCIILGTVFLLTLAALGLCISQSAYMSGKIKTVFNPESDAFGRGFFGTVIHELLSVSHMIGPSDPTMYDAEIPRMQQSTSFLITALICRTGWLTFILIMAIFATFLGLAISKCLKQKNMLGKLISLAVILTLSMQILLYVLLNLGFGLVGEFSLPLVSYGNTALVIDMALIGIMLSTFRTGSLVRDETSVAHRSKVWQHIKDRVHWNDGELTISFKKKLAS